MTRMTSDEELILFHYGEAEDPEAIRAELAASPDSAERYAELVRLLAAADHWTPPELPTQYEGELWRRLQPRLAAGTADGSPVIGAAARFAAGRWRWPAFAAAAAILVALGFLAGRLAPPPQANGGRGGQPTLAAGTAKALSVEARQRILVEALADHLDRSQRLFTELSNAPAGTGDEGTGDRQAARDLVADNRLYRTAAERGGRDGIAALLDEMEPVLIELAHLPAEPAPADVEFLRQRIAERGLLFKTRVASGLLSRSLRPGTTAPLAAPTI